MKREIIKWPLLLNGNFINLFIRKLDVYKSMRRKQERIEIVVYVREFTFWVRVVPLKSPNKSFQNMRTFRCKYFLMKGF